MSAASKPARGADFATRVRRGYHTPAQARAGQRAADICCRAEAGGLRAQRLEDGRTGPTWRGEPDGRMAALGEKEALIRALGAAALSRLRSYTLEGRSLGELAEQCHYRTDEMAAVLKADLDAAVAHFRKQGRRNTSA